MTDLYSCGGSLALSSTELGVFFFSFFMSESTRRLTDSGSVFKKRHRRRAQSHIQQSGGVAGIKLGIPGYKASGLSTTPPFILL